MKRLIFIITVAIVIFSGCKKFLDVKNPRDKVVADYAFGSDNSAIAVVTSIYYEMQRLYAQGYSGISLECGAAADELGAIEGSGAYASYHYQLGNGFWISIYRDVQRCNAAIEGLETSKSLSIAVKNQLYGETKFARAFLYFYLVNFFGDIPLITSTNYAENSKVSRSKKDLVYAQIVNDLNDAIELLNSNYVAADVTTNTSEKVRPNKATAQALLARVYLYMGDWQNAEKMSTLLIENPAYEISSDLDIVFKKNSKEAIWQLQPQTNRFGVPYLNNVDARIFVLDETPDADIRPVWLSENLENAFESGDSRFEKWVGKTDFRDENGIRLLTQYFYPFKYKINKADQPQDEYIMVLRIAEQYLIRAESKINNGNVAGGIMDLNFLRSMRRMSPTTQINNPLPALSVDLGLGEARLAVEHERRIELFTEWGHRWLDLKRTGRINQVMSTLNPAKHGQQDWENYKQFFATPAEDRRLNENLGQTPGWPN